MDTHSYLIGILGGMGPAATVDFMAKVIALTRASGDQEHLPLLVASIPNIPDRTAALTGTGVSPLPQLKTCLTMLETAGVQCVVMPCNTAHYWFSDLRASANAGTEMISIIDAVVDDALRKNVTRLGLLSTDATLLTNLYQKPLTWHGMTCLTPDAGGQKQVMKSINMLKVGDGEKAVMLMETQYRQLLARGAEKVILGCTEIPVILRKPLAQTPEFFIDSNAALARATIRWYEKKVGKELLKEE
ncbi:MAG: amino acid racemase [Burkholderiales bacterium]|jgi:aspartate racemase|nr:amino acid racemase [Burkholderiales bacterium]